MAARYIVIARELANELRAMRQSGSDRLPSEAELCRRFECSRQTIRSALSLLAEKGLILKKHGSGSYIADSASGLSREVCVVIPDENEYIFPSAIRDMKTVLSSRGFTVRACSTGGLVRREREILTSLLGEPPAGIILEAVSSALPCLNADILKQLQAAGIPTVFINCGYDGFDAVPCIRTDDFGAAYALVELLVRKGHRNIAGVMQSDDRRGIERYHGFAAACAASDVEFRQGSFMWFSSEERRRMLDGSDELQRRFIRDYLKPCTAVVCFNDEIAYHIIKALTASGADVPGKVSVVSFDNSYYSRTGTVGITSAGHKDETPGTAAAQTLLSIMAGKCCKSERLSTQIVERESSQN